MAVPPFLNRSLSNLEDEVWIDIAGYEDMYQISSYGRIKSLSRWISLGTKQYKSKDKILSQATAKTETPSIVLCKDGNHVSKTIAVLVADAFLGERPDGFEVCHLNKNTQDNRLCNLKIMSFRDSELVAWKLGVKQDWGIGAASAASSAKYKEAFFHYENGELSRITCTACSTERPVSDFYLKRGDRPSRICKPCQLVRLGVVDVGRNTDRLELAKAGLRYCAICKVLKSLDTDFCKSKDKPFGRSYNCRACMKPRNDAANAKRRELNKSAP